MPNPAEVATVVVNDLQFNNWESVWVQQRWAEAFPVFKFTTADLPPTPGRVSRAESGLARAAATQAEPAGLTVFNAA